MAPSTSALPQLIPSVNHRRGPRGVSFEAKRFGHREVAASQLPIADVVAVSPGRQRAQPQQRDVADRRGLIGPNERQPIDGLPSLGEVAFGATLEQGLHQNSGGPHSISQPFGSLQLVRRFAYHGNRRVALAAPG